METNNIDKNIKEKFANRTFEPSTSAWERLSAQLDEQPQKKKKGWFFYVGAAASILLLISVGILFFNTDKEITPLEIIVDNPIDTTIIDNKIDKFINEIPVEKALVKIDEAEEKEIKNNTKNSDVIKAKQKSNIKKETVLIVKTETEIAIVNVDENLSEKSTSAIKKEDLQQNPNSRIKINSNDLLYAVTHNKADVKAYYAKHSLNREDVLRTIKSELKKSNIKVNPETILAEVERTINDDDFQNNFMKSLKNKISDIATVIASRNN